MQRRRCKDRVGRWRVVRSCGGCQAPTDPAGASGLEEPQEEGRSGVEQLPTSESRLPLTPRDFQSICISRTSNIPVGRFATATCSRRGPCWQRLVEDGNGGTSAQTGITVLLCVCTHALRAWLDSGRQGRAAVAALVACTSLARARPWRTPPIISRRNATGRAAGRVKAAPSAAHDSCSTAPMRVCRRRQQRTVFRRTFLCGVEHGRRGALRKRGGMYGTDHVQANS